MYNKNNAIIQQIFSTVGKIEKIMSQINKSKDALSKNDFSSFEYNFSKEAVTLSARNIANTTFKANNCPRLYNKLRTNIAKEIHKISIEPFEFGFKISLPCTLAHYGDVKKSVLEEPLNTALRNYQKEKGKLPSYDKVFFIVVNHINKITNPSYIRDNDNYDYKQIINTLAFWFLPDDSPKYINLFNTTKVSDETHTEIFIVPQNDFVVFYNKYKDFIV